MLFGKIISYEEVAVDKAEDETKITPYDVSQYIVTNSSQSLESMTFLAEQSAGLGIRTKILINNYSGYLMKLKDYDVWDGKVGSTNLDQEIQIGQASAVVFENNTAVTGIEAALVYELLDKDNKSVGEIFLGWCMPAVGGTNRVYVEVREPGHWWSVGTKGYMQSRIDRATTLEDSSHYGDISIQASIGNEYVSFLNSTIKLLQPSLNPQAFFASSVSKVEDEASEEAFAALRL